MLRIDLLEQAAEDLAGSKFDVGLRAFGDQRLDAIDPAHGAGDLVSEGFEDLGRGVDHFAGDIRGDGDAGIGKCEGAKYASYFLLGRLHERAVEGSADRKHDGAARAFGLGNCGGPLDCGQCARDDRLAGRVEVGGGDGEAGLRCGFSAGLGHLFWGERENGSHAALAGRNGLLHGLSACLDEAHGVGKAVGAGGHVGRPLAQRVSGSQRGLDAMERQHAQGCYAHGENRRLGVFRELELFLRPLEDQLREQEAGGFVGLGEGVAGNGKTLGKFAAHAYALRTLPRKEKCKFISHAREDCNASRLVFRSLAAGINGNLLERFLAAKAGRRAVERFTIDCVSHSFEIGPVHVGEGQLFLIAGPCVIESETHVRTMAEQIQRVASDLGIPYIFKASYDKANRTSVKSFRGPGLVEGTRILGRLAKDTGLTILTDVHEPAHCEVAAEAVDVLQIPAFLCRQTDLLVAAGKTGRAVNIKKGQFVAPWDMSHPVEKVRSTGNERIFLTERGACFGYNSLVVDFRALPVMRSLAPVVFDGTHSVQQPSAANGVSGGQPEFIPLLARAAVAAGIDGLFLEVHDDPAHAKSDGANALDLKLLKPLLERLLAINAAAAGRD